MSTLAFPLVAVVTDRRLFSGPDALSAAVEASVRGGVTLVQMRERDLPDAEQLALAKRLRDVTGGRALLFINDSVSIALASGADGVQLAERSRTVADARNRAGDRLLIGRSVHDTQGAGEAAAQGADLLVAGSIYATLTHPGQPPAGPDLLTAVAAAVPTPVLGIGGITAENAMEAIAAGASGVAVIRSVLGADDPEEAASRLCEAVASAWVERSAV